MDTYLLKRNGQTEAFIKKETNNDETIDSVEKLKEQFKFLFDSLNPDEKKMIFDSLKAAEKENDKQTILENTIDIVNLKKKGHRYRAFSKIKSELNKNFSDVINFFVNDFVRNYLYERFRTIDKHLLLELTEQSLAKHTYDPFFDYLEEGFPKQVVDNGFYALASNTVNNFLDKVLAKSCSQACWECSNGYPSKCEKIRDLTKKPIDKYPFIEEGYQRLEEDAIEDFIIISCQNYQKVKKHSRPL